MAPFLGDLVPVLRGFGELKITDKTATAVCAMSAATIDRRLAPDRAKLQVRGRSHTTPGSLLKDSNPMPTWTDWDDAVPGFVQIDLSATRARPPSGEHAYTLTVTDIATGWTENRSVRNKAQPWVFAALMDIRDHLPFGAARDRLRQRQRAHQPPPVRPVHRAQGYVHPVPVGERKRRRTRGAEDWTLVRQIAGYHRYDTAAELETLNLYAPVNVRRQSAHGLHHWGVRSCHRNRDGLT